MAVVVSRLKSSVPWRAKVAVKILLARLPVPYDSWRRMSLFRHGAMDEPQYALEVFRRHLPTQMVGTGFVMLELGPGDSVASGLLAFAHGATRSYLVDVGRYATENMAPYRSLASKLGELGLPTPDVSSIETIEDLLTACRAEYLTEGLESLRLIRGDSVDFVWSQAVLEHVEREEFLDTLAELRRIMRVGGISSHRVDLEDHLAHSLNNLRFARSRWESPLFRTSGFYTNRLREPEILNACERAGFSVEVTGVERWDRLPIERRHLAREFREMSDEVLRTRALDLVLRPRAPAPVIGGSPP